MSLAFVKLRRKVIRYEHKVMRVDVPGDNPESTDLDRDIPAIEMAEAAELSDATPWTREDTYEEGLDPTVDWLPTETPPA